MDLPAQFLLLATRDRSGRAIGFRDLGFGGAVLAELVLDGAIRIEGKRVRYARDSSNPTYASVVAAIQQGKPRKPEWWVHKLASRRFRPVRDAVYAELVATGTLDRQKGRFSTRYPVANPLPEEQLRQRILHAVEMEDTSDERLVCLAAIATAADVLKEVHPERRERKKIAKQAQRWIKEDAFAVAVGDAVAAAITAIIAASIGATIAASSSS